MFSFDLEKKQKEDEENKEKERQKKIDKLIEESEKKNSNSAESEGHKVESGSFLGKPFVKNKYGNLFIKSVLLPVGGVIGIGVAFWGAGFAVGEASKIAPFLSDISLPTSITGILGTVAFWKFVLLVVAVCAFIFVCASVITAIKDRAMEAGQEQSNRRQISQSRSYELGQHRVHSCGNVKNSKEVYNYKINKNKSQHIEEITAYSYARKNFDYKNKFSSFQRNKQIIRQKNKNNFNSNNAKIGKDYNINRDKMFIEMNGNKINIKI